MDLKVHYLVHNSPSLDSLLNLTISVHTHSHPVSLISPKIILPPTSRSSKYSYFQLKILYAFLIFHFAFSMLRTACQILLIWYCGNPHVHYHLKFLLGCLLLKDTHLYKYLLLLFWVNSNCPYQKYPFHLKMLLHKCRIHPNQQSCIQRRYLHIKTIWIYFQL
jgi:hypothetical protein